MMDSTILNKERTYYLVFEIYGRKIIRLDKTKRSCDKRYCNCQYTLCISLTDTIENIKSFKRQDWKPLLPLIQEKLSRHFAFHMTKPIFDFQTSPHNLKYRHIYLNLKHALTEHPLLIY